MADALSNATPRRGFVGRLLAGAAAAAGGALLGRDLGAQQRAVAPAGAAAGRPVSAAWDMSWVDRITGTHRQVFDSPEIADGTVLHQARTWMSDYAEVYGVKPAQMSGVVVIRHAAIPMVLNDALWNELDLGRTLAKPNGDSPPMTPTILKDPSTGEPARQNPFLTSSLKGGARHALIWPDGGFDSLMERGVIVLACNLALRRAVGLVVSHDGVDATAARAKVMANLLPGVIVMPSGIFAVTRAQEAGCNFLQV
ncbi:MAG: hypothetical protein ACYC2G_08020 [Gemmatimonadaceae bacterium]